MKKVLPLILCACVTVMGCYGPFNLTKKLHRWNGTIGGKWVNEGVFLGLVILPVYELASLGDAIIFNSIEFWTGKNPVTAKNVKSIQSGEDQAVLNYSPAAKRLRVDRFRNGKLEATVVLEPDQEGMVARDAKGEVIMRARTLDNGQIALSDATGQRLGAYDPDRLQELLP
ncbi:MAG TPA: hypothetical protein DEB40_02630 [Elusimicrobia bacterium]|nr:hypothetical protein [Elusimicrobiota bacterium]HBT60626.1 hypothetical protein [Elusimicrobiota bacterium]